MFFSVFLQYVLPHHFVSKIAYFVANIKWRPLKNFLINYVIENFHVDMSEAVISDPSKYESFNKFFTRELRLRERLSNPEQKAIMAPADGKISQMGRITTDTEVQAKKTAFSLCRLLGDQHADQKFANGSFFNIYLSPRDYHRIHMPVDGILKETVYIPGRLFSVAPWAARTIPDLFSRNERLICHFDTATGPMCIVLVGAMLVSGIETVWGGVEIPRYPTGILRKDYRGRGISLKRFSEMGRFNFGSTVICLWPDSVVSLADLKPGSKTSVGQELGCVE